ncbi:hypothetical protein CDL12_28247 [Handroanthus impetiginosus]|uniref:Uncharacterized protein n=1 Tax=Handroanthus impetiginosus TaxID=429701 RepID=A0A2G9G1S9_9LAMI|nr:hypothetical protein CDL12_28247 [Handroanthus impetiginosus]
MNWRRRTVELGAGAPTYGPIAWRWTLECPSMRLSAQALVQLTKNGHWGAHFRPQHELETKNYGTRNLTLPRARERKSCVVFPELPASVNVEIPMIRMIQNTAQFCGFSHENPNRHIDNFLKICDTLRQEEPEDSITTWTAALRVEIITFRQGVSEIVYKPRNRFKKMLWNCPNHDIPRHIQVHIFYHGLTDGGKDKLDHLNGDSFLSGTTAECHNLLNNLVANHYEKKLERATPSKAAGVIEVDQVTILNDKIDFLIQSMKNFGINQVQHTPVTCEECGESRLSDQCPQRQGSAPRFQQSVQQQVQQSMQEKKPSLEKTLMQFMASTVANFKTMETQIDQLANAINLDLRGHCRAISSQVQDKMVKHNVKKSPCVMVGNFKKSSRKLQKRKERRLQKQKLKK